MILANKLRLLRVVLCGALLVSLGGCATTNSKSDSDKKSPKEMAQLFQELGTQALIRGDLPQAVQDLRRAIEIDHGNAIAHSHLGVAYYGLEKNDLAKTELELAIEIDPKYSDAYINLGKYYEDAGKFKIAKTNYLKALENLEYKTRHRALTNLAQLAMRENDLDSARRYLYQALQANPDYCLTHFLMGTLYTRDGSHKRAADEFKKSIISTCTSNIEAHYQLGLAYVRSQEFAKARSQFKLLVEEYPQSTQAQRAAEQLRTLP